MTDGVRSRLRPALHAYRQLGLRRGTLASGRRIARLAQGPVRRIELHHRPLRVTDADLKAAVGGHEPIAVLANAASALPLVRRWSVQLQGLSAEEHRDLLHQADEIAAHRFDLLGSGPTELGPLIDWQRDFKAGRSWPLDHISRIRVSYPDSSDIKVPWELSRCQHLPVLAAAHRISGERRYLDEIGNQLVSWIEANPVEFGANWACTMDVAIRATNWVAALVLNSDNVAQLPWLKQVFASLLLHARFIGGHLEYGEARGNHYLSGVVGLLVIASAFRSSQEGQDWAAWAAHELGTEMAHEVRPDGCCHEASTSYHRLVTELFIVGADAADDLAPGRLNPTVRSGIDRMLEFVADYTRPDGLAPQIGDADNGRLLPLGDYGAADQRSHLHLFKQADRSYCRATQSAAYRHGGFFILRAGDLFASVRCGDVGIYGRGCHAHNDLCAFELCWRSTPLVVDPGSYLYTADPSARNRFRSTAVHGGLQIDGAEQNELREDRLFAMVDRARATAISWEVSPNATLFRGSHHGFEALSGPARHTRTLDLDGDAGALEIVDEVISDAPHELAWCFPLAPCEVELTAGTVTAQFADVRLRMEIGDLVPSVEQGWLSPSYGVRHQAPVVRLRARSTSGEHRALIVLRVDQPPG